MHYKQIIENHGPLNMWTFERYSGDLQNVYDEFDNKTLLNNGATLEEGGQVNQNMSAQLQKREVKMKLKLLLI